MAVDWLKIKTEYINGGISYRELSERHSISQSTIRKKAAAENWTDAKAEQRNKIGTKAEQKTVEKTSEALSDEAATKVRIKATLLRLIENWIDSQFEEIRNTSDFRRIVQCCVDLGVMKEQGLAGQENDGFLEALYASAEQLFEDGDDSDLLPMED